MFWKIFEFIVRIIYFKRFRSAKKIGDASELLISGKPKEALVYLNKAETSLHQTLIPLFAFTKGKILQELEKFAEAEKSFQTVIVSDPLNAKADLELAILTGKQFRFKECKQWLDRACEKEDEKIKTFAVEILHLLTQIENGERKKEFENRAKKIAAKKIGKTQLTTGVAAGVPADVSIFDNWINFNPDNAREYLDEIALLIGQQIIDQHLTYRQTSNKNALWKISLSIEDSVIEFENGKTMNPFELVASCFDSDQNTLVKLLN